MPRIVEDEKGVSLLIEYLILMGVMSVFVVVMSLQLHETLTESQVSRVMENQFADVASQVSAIYTDYILLMPSEGQIVTRISMLPEIGNRQYNLKMDLYENVGYVHLSSGSIESYMGLGYKKFLRTGGVIEIRPGGEVLSSKAESKDQPKVVYKKEEACPFVPKIRVSFDPSSVEFNNFTNMTVSFENEITEPVIWRIDFWNGSSLSDVSYGGVYRTQIQITDITGCTQKPSSSNDYLCTVTAKAWIHNRVSCNSSVNNTLLVSTTPKLSNPYLVYEKWIEPNLVRRGEPFEVHLKLEGRGFVVEGLANLSVVHVIDVSGSMIWPTIFKDYKKTVTPNVISRTITLNENGKLEIYAYTTDSLPSWYNSTLCKCSNKCPVGYDSSLIKLYVNGTEASTVYQDGSAIGKQYTNNKAPNGDYTIEVVAAAPEQINITLKVVFKGKEILNETVPYSNYVVESFTLPGGVNYKFLAIYNITNLPSLSNTQWNSSWNRVEYYTVYGQPRYWEYTSRLCGSNSAFSQGTLNVWLILPDGSKDFLMKGSGSAWYQARNNYGINGIYADAFIVDPGVGEYRFVIVPISKNPVTFQATALIKRIDAAKLAGITFNSMLGEKDFVGLTNFTTDAQRIAVNSSPLRFMTTDKSFVNNLINQMRAELATDHADGLYYGSRVFPVWNEGGNNCTDCIKDTRPLLIMLTDGEPTICNSNNDPNKYYGCFADCSNCTGGSWCEPCKNQALCIANYLKNFKINDFNVSICTIGFSTDISGQGQQFLRQLASLRPDNNEPCYFFATTSDELVNAYKTIFNAFQIAAKNISVQEAVNVSIISPFDFIDARVVSSKGSPVSITVESRNESTVIRLNMSSIQKDEVVELILKLKAKDEAPTGEYDVNIDSESYIEYTVLDYRGQESGRITLPIISDKDKVRIVTGDQPEIIIR